MIKQLLNLVIAKYRDLSEFRGSIIGHRQKFDLLATDKSRYFAHPRPTIVNYFSFLCLLRRVFDKESTNSLIRWIEFGFYNNFN